jgi:DeoR family fructose operon transcriptional repressor
VRGGASAIAPAIGGGDFQHRATERVETKRAIAAEALAFVQAGSVVGVDAGTTTLELARLLPEDRSLTVVTHSLPVLSMLAGRRRTEVYALGGLLHHNTQAFMGPLAVEALKSLRIGTLFLAASSIRDKAMYSNYPHDAEYKRLLVEASDEVVLIADASKFRLTAALKVAPLESVGTLVVDSNIDEESLAMARDCGINVVVATAPFSVDGRHVPNPGLDGAGREGDR